jgi:hypothetical protein
VLFPLLLRTNLQREPVKKLTGRHDKARGGGFALGQRNGDSNWTLDIVLVDPGRARAENFLNDITNTLFDVDPSLL